MSPADSPLHAMGVQSVVVEAQGSAYRAFIARADHRPDLGDETKGRTLEELAPLKVHCVRTRTASPEAVGPHGSLGAPADGVLG